ncbi:uncharacterized protein N7515_007804 [Penicillium bovifimosum]|uniref:Uncharacterized protein n=1 Tax=Penicillium bovifimosum TaxID=126998 RepID=A0A9W9GM13_9EURO|nr:uncharacterized protein N7515_007804 [Penicillium bovifimosum]KAJ5123979.1 hypothetical protein N7515_007804 [Penicillium bovifimosum]
MNVQLLTLVLLVPSAIAIPANIQSENILERRATCKTFQLYKNPDSVSGGSPGHVGHSACCCASAQCVLHDYTDDVGADCNMVTSSLGCDWEIISGSNQAVGSLDVNGATYTVAGLGGC